MQQKLRDRNFCCKDMMIFLKKSSIIMSKYEYVRLVRQLLMMLSDLSDPMSDL